MFSTGYVVLLVDDEPDVLQVSKLAMRSFDRFRLKVAAAPNRSEFGYVARVPGEVPETFPPQFYGLARPAAVRWHRAST